MKSISIAELVDEGYSEDAKSLKVFSRPYLIPSIIGIAAYAICFYWLVTKTSKATLIYFGIAMLFCGAITLTINFLVRKTDSPASLC